ncbi:MAG: cell envelope integrity protein TolA [Bacteroidia bacterium]|nr:cell envelope integrity protein TolA [Bacteroidia bacterium]
MDQRRDDKYRAHGVVGTVLFHAVLLLILAFTLLETTPVEEEGLLVNYGFTDNGQGSVEPAPATTPVETQPQQVEEATPPPPAPAQPSAPAETVKADGQVKDTQDFEEAAALREAKKKADEQAKAEAKAKAEAEAKEKAKRDAELKAQAEAKAKAEAEARAKAQAEAAEKARLEAERIAKEKAEAEAKAKAEKEAAAKKAAQDAIRKGMSGKGTGNSNSQGNTTGVGNQGSLTGGAGNGTGGGTQGNGVGSVNLEGRTLQGTLPKPVYNIQEQGNVAVEIHVDKYGTVKSATVISKGTTVQNKQLWAVAVEAAKKAKFDRKMDAAVEQVGTITYRFRLQ